MTIFSSEEEMDGYLDGLRCEAHQSKGCLRCAAEADGKPFHYGDHGGTKAACGVVSDFVDDDPDWVTCPDCKAKVDAMT